MDIVSVLRPSVSMPKVNSVTRNSRKSKNTRFLGLDPAVACTANTMASAIEALGNEPSRQQCPSSHRPSKRDDCQQAGAAVVKLLEKNIKPRDIMTRHAFENAIMTCLALGGSTNLILHLLAIAHSADVPLTIDDFKTIGARIPLLADVKPFGRYNMSHLIRHRRHPPHDEMLA